MDEANSYEVPGRTTEFTPSVTKGELADLHTGALDTLISVGTQ